MTLGVAISVATCLLFVAVAFAQNDTPKNDAASDQKALILLLNQKLSDAAAARDAGDWNKAIAILQEASTIDPSRDLLWFKLGEAYRSAGRYSEAVTAYDKAIAIKPIGPYYNNLGEAERKLGNFRSAVDAYRGAAQVDPENAFKYYFNIGAVETNRGDFDAANVAYDDAIRANPAFAAAYYFKGLNLLNDARTVHGKAQVPAEASQVLQKYLELAPDGPYAALCRRTLEFIGGNLVTTYSRASSPDPPSRDRHQPETTDVPAGLESGFILRKVQPSYPELARNARIEGPVVFDAIIGEDGDVLNLRVLVGNPFLVGAAVDSVQQWKYKRFLLMGEPAKVQTQVWVNFVLTDDPQPPPRMPLRLLDILQLLQNGLAPDRVASLIHECKVSFDIDDAGEHQLREAGGDDDVVQAIKKNHK